MSEALFKGFDDAVELFVRGEMTRAEVLRRFRSLWSHSDPLPPLTCTLLGLHSRSSYASAVRHLDKHEKAVRTSHNVVDIPGRNQRGHRAPAPQMSAPRPIRAYHPEVEEGCERVIASAKAHFFFGQREIDMALLKILARRVVAREIGVRDAAEIAETTQQFARQFQKVLMERLTAESASGLQQH